MPFKNKDRVRQRRQGSTEEFVDTADPFYLEYGGRDLGEIYDTVGLEKWKEIVSKECKRRAVLCYDKD